MTTQVAERFGALFDGRHDAYGISTSVGVGCQRVPEGTSSHADVMQSHLNGFHDFGVYPMRYWMNPDGEEDWRVKWVCVDLDVAAPGKRRYDFDTTADAQAAADRLILAANADGIGLFPEITKSGGVHVWGFLQHWTPAETARNAMLGLCQRANVPTTEVNPKQTSLPSADSLGNFVRLPHYHVFQRPIVMPQTWRPMALVDFLASAEQALIAPATISGAASRYVPPQPPAPLPYVGEPVEVDKDWIRNLPPLMKTILKGGMGRSHDRSSWLYYLACKCSEEGLSPEDGLAFVELADALHSDKYQGRPDADERYRELVERAYA